MSLVFVEMHVWIVLEDICIGESVWHEAVDMS